MTKSTKKAKKGLLISLFTLVIALAITATSTYAWFVVNREVTASNMQVTVRSDTTYLVIKKADSVPSDVDALGTGITETMDAVSRAVLPVMYDENESGSGVIKWKTASGTGYDNGAAIDGDDVDESPDYTPISSEDVSAGRYFVKYTFYVGLTSTTALPASNLKVKSMELTANGDTTFRPAVSAVVNCGSTWLDYEDIYGKSGTYYTGKSALSDTVALNTVYTVDVYVYINGDNDVVKSSNATAAKLDSFLLSITLECTPGAYSA